MAQEMLYLLFEKFPTCHPADNATAKMAILPGRPDGTD
jgi:hypothetical protein